MPFKSRIERDELKTLRILNERMELTEEDKRRLSNLEKGYRGELMFDEITDKLPESKFLVLNDLELEVNKSKFQIDSSIIIQGRLYYFDVKNWEEDYEFNHEKNIFTKIRGSEIGNPLEQLKRAGLLLKQLLQSIGYNIPIEGNVVFINPEFHLYNSSKNQPIIFQTQLNRYMKNFEAKTSKIGDWQTGLAQKLVSLHQMGPPDVPKYEYSQVRKGLTSGCCHSFDVKVEGKELVCNPCGKREKLEDAAMRLVSEIQLLFPELKITTNLVHEWCEGVVSEKVIRRYLERNFTKKGNKKYSHYE